MVQTQKYVVLIVSIILMVASTLTIQSKLVEANVELDNLALQFQNGFDIASRNAGFTSASSNQLSQIGDADKKMRDLYAALSRNLMEARQRAANARSFVTFSTIEKLKLV